MRFLKILTMFLILALCLQGCSNSAIPQNILDNYSKSIASGIPSDMSLTIYYMGFLVEADPPHINEAHLIEAGNSGEIEKIVIDSAELESRLDQLKKIDSAVLQTPKKGSHKDARLYYYIETETAGKVLEVTMNGLYGTMFVNGIEVDYNPVFYDLVSPYLEGQ